MGCLIFCLIEIFFNFKRLPIPEDARSLAIPLTPRQSALFGVIEISKAFSDLDLKKLFPISFSLFLSSTIPALSSDKFNSLSEQSASRLYSSYFSNF